ncbi:ATPase [Sphingomonas ginkgonis]|uniref:ATPase n=1 Tax=Sphingomonas ginkgonis TaxID=2315330 RepID=A0A3R9WQL3_9SPHN|nr:ATP12 family protein [Sphingomonas ginkgonis]RST31972.1 ATPase [Sphingomonas ginkgonis]
MKRFWKEAAVDAGGRVLLDGRPVRTPARAELVLPTATLADAVAAEWDGVGERVDPRVMPLTGLANAALDRVAPDPETFAAGLARYAEGDLLSYRAEHPDALVERQAGLWDPLLAWARDRHGAELMVTVGISPVRQSADAVERLGAAVRAFDPFRLAGLSPLVTIGGSLVVALAVIEGKVTPEQGWAAVSLDEAWQLERWGEDPEALMALRNRERDWLAAARFLALL